MLYRSEVLYFYRRRFRAIVSCIMFAEERRTRRLFDFLGGFLGLVTVNGLGRKSDAVCNYILIDTQKEMFDFFSVPRTCVAPPFSLCDCVSYRREFLKRVCSHSIVTAPLRERMLHAFG